MGAVGCSVVAAAGAERKLGVNTDLHEDLPKDVGKVRPVPGCRRLVRPRRPISGCGVEHIMAQVDDISSSGHCTCIGEPHPQIAKVCQDAPVRRHECSNSKDSTRYPCQDPSLTSILALKTRSSLRHMIAIHAVQMGLSRAQTRRQCFSNNLSQTPLISVIPGWCAFGLMRVG